MGIKLGQEMVDAQSQSDSQDDASTLTNFLKAHPILTWTTVALAAVPALVGLRALVQAIFISTPETSAESLDVAVQAFLGLAALGVAVLFSGVLTDALQQRAIKDQRARELVRLSEKMVDTEFYIKVMYPAWEVALKWMDDSRPDIDRYRAEVIGAEIRLPKNYLPGQTHALAESEPRRHPHYVPYDTVVGDGKSAVINELSESLAFATWVRFWRNVQFLVDKGLLEPSATRHLLREWYSWWAPFMTEFAAVGVKVHDLVEKETEYRFHKDGWENGSMVKLKELHEKVFEFPPHCGRAPDAFGNRIDAVTSGVMKHVRESLKESKNIHVDWEKKPDPHQDRAP